MKNVTTLKSGKSQSDCGELQSRAEIESPSLETAWLRESAAGVKRSLTYKSFIDSSELLLGEKMVRLCTEITDLKGGV